MSDLSDHQTESSVENNHEIIDRDKAFDYIPVINYENEKNICNAYGIHMDKTWKDKRIDTLKAILYNLQESSVSLSAFSYDNDRYSEKMDHFIAIELGQQLFQKVDDYFGQKFDKSAMIHFFESIINLKLKIYENSNDKLDYDKTVFSKENMCWIDRTNYSNFLFKCKYVTVKTQDILKSIKLGYQNHIDKQNFVTTVSNTQKMR